MWSEWGKLSQNMLTVNGMHRNYIICTRIPLKQQRTDNGAHCSNLGWSMPIWFFTLSPLFWAPNDSTLPFLCESHDDFDLWLEAVFLHTPHGSYGLSHNLFDHTHAPIQRSKVWQNSSSKLSIASHWYDLKGTVCLAKACHACHPKFEFDSLLTDPIPSLLTHTQTHTLSLSVYTRTFERGSHLSVCENEMYFNGIIYMFPIRIATILSIAAAAAVAEKTQTIDHRLLFA